MAGVCVKCKRFRSSRSWDVSNPILTVISWSGRPRPAFSHTTGGVGYSFISDHDDGARAERSEMKMAGAGAEHGAGWRSIALSCKRWPFSHCYCTKITSFWTTTTRNKADIWEMAKNRGTTDCTGNKLQSINPTIGVYQQVRSLSRRDAVSCTDFVSATHGWLIVICYRALINRSVRLVISGGSRICWLGGQGVATSKVWGGKC